MKFPPPRALRRGARFSGRLLLGLLLLVALCLVTGGLARPAHAATTLTVTDCSSDSQLQAAVAQANHDNAGEVITFACSGDIKLTSTLTITGSMTLSGSGQQVTLDGGDSLQVLSVQNVSFTLQALTIAHGVAAVIPGGIIAGGGLANTGGTVSISTSTFSANTEGGGSCGGLFNDPTGTLSISSSTISANLGGAICNDGTLSISSSTISANPNGGIGNGGTLSISSSTFANNSAPNGGGIESVGGNVTISSSTFSGNSASNIGGGLFSQGGPLTISSSTFSANTAGSAGGGFYNDGPLTVTNSTISGNTTGGQGGGLFTSQVFSTTTISNSTIANNSAPSGQGGGIVSDDATGPTSLTGSIVAANSGGNCTTLEGGSITSGGYNLESGTDCGFTSTGDLQNSNPKLGPLANNGGPTQTMALLKGSPAIDAIPLSSGRCPTTDQRGHKRPDNPHENACDMGAYES